MPTSGGASGGTSTAADFYGLLASAVSAATSGPTAQPGQSSSVNNPQERDLSNSGTLIPPTIQGNDRISFISAQRERLAILLSALDKEASNLNAQDPSQKSSPRGLSNIFFDGNRSGEPDPVRPPSAMSGLSKSRSEVDFEKIEREDEDGEDSQTPMPSMVRQNTGSGSWLPWSWGAKSAATVAEPTKEREGDSVMSGTGNDQGKSSGIDI
jgi:receptor expression-enhancing protein 1/2/3/4